MQLLSGLAFEYAATDNRAISKLDKILKKL